VSSAERSGLQGGVESAAQGQPMPAPACGRQSRQAEQASAFMLGSRRVDYMFSIVILIYQFKRDSFLIIFEEAAIRN
jgi:hypothetical protein